MTCYSGQIIPDPICDVAIIGAGFSGTMVAVHLMRSENELPPSVALIEKASEFGRGAAYGTSCQQHLLNVPAGKMSAFPDRPHDFVEWLEAHRSELRVLGGASADGGTFMPRMIYGRYLASLLEKAGTRGYLSRFRGEAIDVVPLANGELRVALDNGTKLRARKVVLALGNFPPGNPRLSDHRFHNSPRFLNAPWTSDATSQLAGEGDVLILGSGLTCLDLLVSLERLKSKGKIYVLSRRGLFPQPHQSFGGYPPYRFRESLPITVRGMLRQVREEIAVAASSGIDWRVVIDSLRPITQKFWCSLSDGDRRRFLRHLRPYWEAHRHRVSPDVLAIKARLEESGRLICLRGRIQEIRDIGDEFEVRLQKHSAFQPDEHRVKFVVNCTGPESNYHNLRGALVEQLFARGLIRPDPLFLGLDVTPGGSVLNARGKAQGNVFTLGSPQKGLLFETTAVPELRVQAFELAQYLASELAHSRTPPLESPDPEPDYTYQI